MIMTYNLTCFLSCYLCSLPGWIITRVPHPQRIWIRGKQLAHSFGGIQHDSEIKNSTWLPALLSCPVLQDSSLLLSFFLKQGGGWCNSITKCVFSKKTRHGSSHYMEKQIPFEGILSNKAEENPGHSCLLTTSSVDFHIS